MYYALIKKTNPVNSSHFVSRAKNGNLTKVIIRGKTTWNMRKMQSKEEINLVINIRKEDTIAT